VKRLLGISWDMPPMGGPRAVQVSRLLNHLVPLGWQSTVVCFGPRSNRYPQDPTLAGHLRADGVTVVHVRSLEERLFFRALWRIVPPIKRLPDEKWVWIRTATRAAMRLAETQSFDAVVSFAQPWSDHLVGLRVQRALRLPWVAHFSDPWVDSPYLRGRPWQQRIWRRMEASVVEGADALVFVNRQTADRTMAKYPAGWRAKAHVVPHGFEPRDVETHAPRADTRLHVVYTGRFYNGLRTPAPLLRALASLAARRPLADALALTLVGPIVPAHRRLASKLRLDGVVEFVGRQSAADAARRAADADVLLLVDAPADENLFLPSKLVDYLPLDKPILALTSACGATADVVRAAGYPVVPPDDEAAIAAAIEGLLDAKREGRLGPAPGHRAVTEQFDIRRTAAAFAEVLARCA
jgi:glycosyltransferase involved in cell wall biosynthesis